MKRLMVLLICTIVAGCRQDSNADKPITTDSVKYPLLIDSGKKIIYQFGRMTEKGWQVYLDTITFTKGQLYRQDSIRHPLRQFYLSYPEWKTIGCIIAVDEHDYGDKAMIGLIEKSGKLRISYLGQTLHLTPTTSVRMEEGDWTGTFKNDSVEILVSGKLENKRILRSLTGDGTLIFKTPTQTKMDTVFLVYKKE